jgi:hypothetical protein
MRPSSVCHDDRPPFPVVASVPSFDLNETTGHQIRGWNHPARALYHCPASHQIVEGWAWGRNT